LNPGTPSGFEAQLLDDFFSEADEHLIGIRHGLQQLESSIGAAIPEAKTVQELFQNFHSFKGISALVGLGPAEELAHVAEDFLRLMREGKCLWTENGLELLMGAARRLEEIVAAFRAREPIPEIESLLGQLRKECEQGTGWRDKPNRVERPSTEASPTVHADIAEARAAGLLLWKCSFTPSRELDAEGINVNYVRAQLSKGGSILKAVPNVKGKGDITFEFLVAARENPASVPGGTGWQ
jgi:two-component system chemotaxis sensor kinase CheA